MLTQVDYFDEAPVGYLTVDAAGVIREVNRTFCQWLGLTPPEEIGRVHV